MILNNTLHNSTVTVADIRRAHDVFGPAVPSLQGKTKQRIPEPVESTILARIPASLFKNIRHATLSIDFMFVNSVPFHVSKMRRIEFGTIKAVDNLSTSTMLRCTKSIIQKYQSRGITIDEVMSNNQFTPIADEIGPPLLNICAPNEHVGDIEVFVRTLKERSHCIHSALPYGL
mmetsp:Transcript_461/g.751  ORF Transcript_461/g.751 Transcript_461/m.751 type:complete len:174 (-) Transcript_461:165-686(-)